MQALRGEGEGDEEGTFEEDFMALLFFFIVVDVMEGVLGLFFNAREGGESTTLSMGGL